MPKEGLIRLSIDIKRFLPTDKKLIGKREADALLINLHKYLKRKNFIFFVNKYEVTNTDIYDVDTEQ